MSAPTAGATNHISPVSGHEVLKKRVGNLATVVKKTLPLIFELEADA